MTKENESQEHKESDGLPELSGSKSSAKKSKGSPVLFIAVIIVLLGGLGFGVQYGISQLGLFEEKQIIVSEPPVPVFDSKDESNEYIASDNEVSNLDGYVIEGEEIAGQVTGESSLSVGEASQSLESSPGLSVEQFNELRESLSNVGSVLAAVNEQNTLIENIQAEQLKIMNKLDTLTDYSFKTGDRVSQDVRDNARWLIGLSNQLRDIGLSVRSAKEEFPLVVYHSNIWGDETYLTVAPKEHPDQTRFMKVGDFTGKWKLIVIGESIAKFEHLEGSVKELRLQ